MKGSNLVVKRIRKASVARLRAKFRASSTRAAEARSEIQRLIFEVIRHPTPGGVGDLVAQFQAHVDANDQCERDSLAFLEALGWGK
jgi:hypothetical protein